MSRPLVADTTYPAPFQPPCRRLRVVQPFLDIPDLEFRKDCGDTLYGLCRHLLDSGSTRRSVKAFVLALRGNMLPEEIEGLILRLRLGDA